MLQALKFHIWQRVSETQVVVYGGDGINRTVDVAPNAAMPHYPIILPQEAVLRHSAVVRAFLRQKTRAPPAVAAMVAIADLFKPA